ncbi:MAG: hypothetical protein ACRD2G_02320 [Terriglobia bacterium]
MAKLLGAKLIDEDITAGPDPSVYGFIRLTAHRNLYRIPLQ